MKFLIDAQLPPLLSDWISNINKHSARHVKSLEDGLMSTDNAIWETALKSDETIITK